MRERYGAKDPRSWMLRCHAQTAGVSLTAQQPENNIVRVTLQALSAVLGGVQSLHANSLDEALALPSESAAALALRTQQIIAHESGVVNTVDPLGGSYAIESMTEEIEAGVEEYLGKINQMGGMLRAIKTGYIQREIQESAYRDQIRIEAGERILVGVNRFAGEESSPIDISIVDDTVAENQKTALRDLRRERNAGAVRRALEDLREAAGSDKNLMPHILEAVESFATLGEISDCLRQVFGEFTENVVI